MAQKYHSKTQKNSKIIRLLRNLAVGAFLLSFLLSTPQLVHADASEAGQAARLASHTVYPQAKREDPRVALLTSFLEAYRSPLAPYAQHLITTADDLKIDWRLVASIAGVESTFGRHVPAGSYNGWGWGIPTGKSYGIAFSSWEDGISTVSLGLKQKYINDGLTTIEQIGRRYAASPTWASKVRFFMEKLTNHKVEEKQELAFTL